MSVHLPEPLDAYFAAGNGRDIERITECFVPDARVHDEGEWREGHAEIARWAREAREKFDFTSTPLAVEGAADEPVVTALVEGSFPGSPVELRYRFGLRDGRIASLRIA